MGKVVGSIPALSLSVRILQVLIWVHSSSRTPSGWLVMTKLSASWAKVSLILSDGVKAPVPLFKLSETTGANTGHIRESEVYFWQKMKVLHHRPDVWVADTEVSFATECLSALVSKSSRFVCQGPLNLCACVCVCMRNGVEVWRKRRKKMSLCNSGVREGFNVPAVPPHGNKWAKLHFTLDWRPQQPTVTQAKKRDENGPKVCTVWFVSKDPMLIHYSYREDKEKNRNTLLNNKKKIPQDTQGGVQSYKWKPAASPLGEPEPELTGGFAH